MPVVILAHVCCASANNASIYLLEVARYPLHHYQMNLTSLTANRYVYQDLFAEDVLQEMENLTSSTWTGMVFHWVINF